MVADSREGEDQVDSVTAEDQRLRASTSLGLIGTGPEERFERITRAARSIFSVPVAAVNLLDDRHLFAKSPQVPGRTVRDRVDTFCDVTIREDSLTIAADTAADSRFDWKPDVVGGTGVRFYAGRPLHVDGQPVGTLCLYDLRPRELSEEELARFDAMGAWAERELLDSRDLEQAVSIQHALLPTANPAAPLYAVAGLTMPLKGVGGDFFVWHRTEETLCLTLADVMGKGIAAALMAATVRATVNSIKAPTPAALLEEAAETLGSDFEATGIFATVFHARLDLGTGVLAYADAGHGLNLIVRADGTHERLEAAGLPLGLELGMPREDRHTVLSSGDTLLSFTDGLLDFYGGTQEAIETIASVIGDNREPASIVESVRTLTSRASIDDDLSVVAVHRP